MRKLFELLIDEIKTANTIIDNAIGCDDADTVKWYKEKAYKQIDTITIDYEYAIKTGGLIEKSRKGDEIADLLIEYLSMQIGELYKRINAM